MRAGELNKRVKFMVKTRTPDGGGGYDVALTEVAEVWAKVVQLSFRERAVAGQVAIAGEYNVTIRPREDIGSDMIVVYKGQEHEITMMPPIDMSADRIVITISKLKLG